MGKQDERRTKKNFDGGKREDQCSLKGKVRPGRPKNGSKKIILSDGGVDF